MFDEVTGDCQNCGKRPATERWVGELGLLGATHGMWKPWCKVCVLGAQIEMAERQVAQLDALRAELDRQNGLAEDVQTTNFQLTKVIADIITGHIKRRRGA